MAEWGSSSSILFTRIICFSRYLHTARNLFFELLLIFIIITIILAAHFSLFDFSNSHFNVSFITFVVLYNLCRFKLTSQPLQ